MPSMSDLKTYALVTFGCQMNVHDSEKISGLLKAKGLKPVNDLKEADIVIFNTCSIRHKAEEKFFTALGRMKKIAGKNGRKIIVVAGCTAQVSPYEVINRGPYIDLVIGPRSLNRITEDIEKLLEKEEPIIDINLNDNIFSDNKYIDANCLHDRPSPVKAFITIMEGCNNLCSYCIVPYTRGEEVYRDTESILDEIKRLIDIGYMEIILLGQNVNSYNSNGTTFADLLFKVSRVGGIKRVRFITSHPASLDDKTIEIMASEKTICPHIHLPLQSGSNVILEAMNRKYSFDYYMNRVDKLKNYFINISLSTDIIVGFPEESEKDFLDTIRAIEMIKFDQIFSFIYSARPNTAAESFIDNVPMQVKKQRLKELQDVQRKIQIQKNREDIGKVFPVLVDGFSKKDKTVLSGRTPHNKLVNIISQKNLLHKIINVIITDATQNSLIGSIDNG